MIAFFDEEMVAAETVAIPPNDAGFMLGASVVERLRTFAGKPFALAEHFTRLRNSLKIAGFQPQQDLPSLEETTREIVAANFSQVEPGDDLSVSIVVTPGPIELAATSNARPLTIITAEPIDFRGIPARYQHGQRLRTTHIRQTSPTCWPPELKCRSRMHYFLADQAARAIEPTSRALMQDDLEFVTEATTANTIVYNDDLFRSPPLEKVLPGVTLARTESFVQGWNATFRYKDLTVADFESAAEVLLTSTTPSVIPAVSLNGQLIGNGKPGPMFRKLIDKWSQTAGFDMIEQAQRFENRNGA